MNPIRILLIDDNPGDRALAIRSIKKEIKDLEIQEVYDPISLKRAIAAKRFDVVVTDFQIRWTTGIDVLLSVKKRDPNLPVIMFTHTGTEEIAVEAMKLGLDDYILKQSDLSGRLPAAITRSLENARTRIQLERYTNIRFEDLHHALQSIQTISDRLLNQSHAESEQHDLQQIHDYAQTATMILQTLSADKDSIV